MQDDLRSLFAYNRWANARLLAAAAKLTSEGFVEPPVPGWSSLRATLLHIADATAIWARRIQGEHVTGRMAETDAPALKDVEAVFNKSQQAFEALLAELTPERLAAKFTYIDLQGKEHSLPLWCVFRHVANHATYHRGQAASKLKMLGIDPPGMDFSAWAIEELAL